MNTMVYTTEVIQEAVNTTLSSSQKVIILIQIPNIVHLNRNSILLVKFYHGNSYFG